MVVPFTADTILATALLSPPIIFSPTTRSEVVCPGPLIDVRVTVGRFGHFDHQIQIHQELSEHLVCSVKFLYLGLLYRKHY